MKDWPRYELRRRTIRHLRFEVYDRDDELGHGRCLSVYVRSREVLRFDLFAPAHMHVRKERDSPRHFYPAGLAFAELVDLALDDLSARIDRVTRDDLAWLRTELLDGHGARVVEADLDRQAVK
jgi:hypothetical protein